MSQNERIYRTQAVVLSRRDYGEADRILTIFTPDLGKQEWIAKGIRKTTSRKAGHLELFTHATLLVAKARTWDIVTEAATLESFPHLRTNLDAIGYTSCICELISHFTEKDDDNLPLWDLLLLTLRALNTAYQGLTEQHVPAQPSMAPAATQPVGEGETITAAPQVDRQVDPQLLLCWFELHLLGVTGFQPQLFHCLACSEALTAVTNFLSLEDGGVFCPRCASGQDNVEPLEADVLKILRHLQRSSWSEVQLLHVRSFILQAAETILYRYLITVLERQLKSVTFLRKLQSTFPKVAHVNNPMTTANPIGV